MTEIRRAVLFDLDGLLVDSLQATTQYYRLLFEHHGLPVPPETAFESLLPLTLVGTLQALLPGQSHLVEELLKAVDELPYPVEDVDLMPCALETVSAASSSDWRVGIVTSRIRRDTSRIVSHFEIPAECVLSIDDYQRPKPSPEGLLMACDELKVDPRGCVYVGDALTDVEAARAASMRSVLVGHVHGHDAADLCLDSLCQSWLRISSLPLST